MVVGTSIFIETQSIGDDQLKLKTNVPTKSDLHAFSPYKISILEVSNGT